MKRGNRRTPAPDPNAAIQHSVAMQERERILALLSLDSNSTLSPATKTAIMSSAPLLRMEIRGANSVSPTILGARLAERERIKSLIVEDASSSLSPALLSAINLHWSVEKFAKHNGACEPTDGASSSSAATAPAESPVNRGMAYMASKTGAVPAQAAAPRTDPTASKPGERSPPKGNRGEAYMAKKRSMASCKG